MVAHLSSNPARVERAASRRTAAHHFILTLEWAASRHGGPPVLPGLSLGPNPGPTPFSARYRRWTASTVNHLTRTSQAINVYVSLDDDSFIGRLHQNLE